MQSPGPLQEESRRTRVRERCNEKTDSNDAREGPQITKWKWPLETVKGKEMD